MGLVVGTPMDLNTGFDLNKATGQAKAWRQIKKQHPPLIFMAPVCTAWSPLSNSSPKGVVEEKRKAVLPMVHFTIKVAKYQAARDRYFVIENPAASQL